MSDPRQSRYSREDQRFVRDITDSDAVQALSFDEYLVAVLSDRSIDIHVLMEKSYITIYRRCRNIFLGLLPPEHRAAQEHWWCVLLEEHSLLLMQSLNRLQLLIEPYLSEQDVWSEISFDTFQVHFENTRLNLETLLANVYYAADELLRRDSTKHQVSADAKALRSTVPEGRHARPLKLHMAGVEQLTRVRARPKQRRRASNPDLFSGASEPLRSPQPGLRRQNSSPLLVPASSPREWPPLTLEQRKAVKGEIRQQQSLYSLIADGNYSYEVLSRLDAVVAAYMARVGYRPALIKILERADHLERRFDDFATPEMTLKRAGWLVYHVLEVLLLPLLVILIKPSDKWEAPWDLGFDIFALAVVGLFSAGGLLKLQKRGAENEASLVICRRKHLLSKCQHVALLLRVMMIIDQLMPAEARVTHLLVEPRVSLETRAATGKSEVRRREVESSVTTEDLFTNEEVSVRESEEDDDSSD